MNSLLPKMKFDHEILERLNLKPVLDKHIKPCWETNTHPVFL